MNLYTPKTCSEREGLIELYKDIIQSPFRTLFFLIFSYDTHYRQYFNSKYAGPNWWNRSIDYLEFQNESVWCLIIVAVMLSYYTLVWFIWVILILVNYRTIYKEAPAQILKLA